MTLELINMHSNVTNRNANEKLYLLSKETTINKRHKKKIVKSERDEMCHFVMF